MTDSRFFAKVRAAVHLRNLFLRQCLAEFLGVFILIVIALSGAAQAVTSEGKKGNVLTGALTAGIGIMIAMYVSAGVSGGHLNPAFSFSMCLLDRFPWWKLPFYCVLQTLGAFLGAGIVYTLYYDAIYSYSNGTLMVTGPHETASIFATYPASYLSLRNGFFDQVLGTAVLVLGILAILDTRNKGMPEGLEPIGVGLLVICLALSMGANCSCAINPARDLGPRLFTFLAGWGPQVFRAGKNWWWVPIVAPMLGGAIGAFVYELAVEFHHPPDQKEVASLGKRSTEKEADVPVFAMNAYAESWMDASVEARHASERQT